jgi:hypothetical protein
VTAAEQHLRRLLGPSEHLQDLVDQVVAEAAAEPAHRALPAGRQGCQLYAHNSPPHPLLVQGHHRFPEYLQRRVWGETRDGHLLWLCGLCHDAVHEMIRHQLGEGRRPDPWPGNASPVRREAQHAIALYRIALEGETGGAGNAAALAAIARAGQP